MKKLRHRILKHLLQKEIKDIKLSAFTWDISSQIAGLSGLAPLEYLYKTSDSLERATELLQWEEKVVEISMNKD